MNGEISHDEMVYMIMETEKSHDRTSVIWGPRTTGAVIPDQV